MAVVVSCSSSSNRFVREAKIRGRFDDEVRVFERRFRSCALARCVTTTNNNLEFAKHIPRIGKSTRDYIYLSLKRCEHIEQLCGPGHITRQRFPSVYIMRLPFQLLLSVALLQSLASAQDADQSCAPGTELIDNGCTPCQPGQFGLGGAAQCQACPDGQYSDEGASECYTVTCDPGSVYNGNGDCQQCYPGQYSTGDSCQMCPEGFFSSQGSTECNECPANTYTNYDFSGCEPCPGGTTSFPGSPDSSRCIATDCPVGTGAYGQFGCFGCDFGTYSPGGSSTCEICSPGSVPNESVKFRSKSKQMAKSSNFLAARGRHVLNVLPGPIATRTLPVSRVARTSLRVLLDSPRARHANLATSVLRTTLHANLSHPQHSISVTKR